MGRADDEDEAVAGDGRGDERRVVDGALDEAEFGGAVADGGGCLSGVANRQAQVDAGMGAAKRDEMARSQ